MISNLEYYKAFYYTAKCGSVTGAAALLSISQPAVSQSIRQLEKNLGVTLFGRASRGVKLTAEGELLYSYVEKGYEQIEIGVEKVRQMRNLELGEGRIDFGVVSTPFETSDDIKAMPVREIEDVFVAGRRFLPYKNKMLDFKELEKLPMIFLENNTSSRSYMDEFLLENEVILQPEFELATSDMIVQFALRSLGIGCVVREFAEEALESGRLFELRFNKMIPKRNFCVVRSRKAALPAAAERLLDIMQYL